jgi:hypothetical protein
MAGSPILKVYSPEGEYVASCKEVIGAAVLVATYGDGSTIRLGHNKKSTLYTQGVDGDASQSYDTTGELMASRAGYWADSIIY